MADERTMSSITLLNSAQRNRQKVETVVAMAQINSFYKGEKPKKVRTYPIPVGCLIMSFQLRKTSRPNPVVKFFDIHRLLRTIDDDDNDQKAQAEYDESDDEEEVILREPGEDLTTPVSVDCLWTTRLTLI